MILRVLEIKTEKKCCRERSGQEEKVEDIRKPVRTVPVIPSDRSGARSEHRALLILTSSDDEENRSHNAAQQIADTQQAEKSAQA